MYLKAPLILVVCIAAISYTNAREQCNWYNFMVKTRSCGVQWWKENDLSKDSTVSGKVTLLVKEAVDKLIPRFHSKADEILKKTHDTLKEYHLDEYADQLFELFGQKFASTGEKIKKAGEKIIKTGAKITESVLIAEPSIVAYMADVIHGLEITGDELEFFGFPKELASKKVWVELVQEYFDASCAVPGTKTFAWCLADWRNQNCYSEEDSASFIDDMLSNYNNAYCSGSKAKPEVVEAFTKDLGSLTKTSMEFYGVKRDSQSPFKFRLLNDSVIRNKSALVDMAKKLAKKMKQDCTFQVSVKKTIEFVKLFMPRSKVGTGVMIKKWKGLLNSHVECMIESVRSFAPELVSENVLKKYSYLFKRYGVSDLSNMAGGLSAEIRDLERMIRNKYKSA